MNKGWKDYFHFSKSERRGILFLSAIIIVLLVVKYFLSSFISVPEIDEKYAQQLLAQSVTDTVDIENTTANFPTVQNNESPTFKEKKTQKLFYFNPNKVTASELQALGCSEKLIKTWMNFVSKGGKFKVKEDVKKVYGVSDFFYKKIENYIQIDAPEAFAKTEENKSSETSKQASDFKTKNTIVELNTSDTLQLKYLPGIGSKLAQRIVAYRNRLGGFVAKEQLKEVFGIDSLLYQKIENTLALNQNTINKLSINYSEVAILKQHPYFSYNIANAIVQYRDRHGKYASLNDLKKVAVINETTFKKISPYLKL